MAVITPIFLKSGSFIAVCYIWFEVTPRLCSLPGVGLVGLAVSVSPGFPQILVRSLRMYN